jgi:ribosomal protein S1
MSEEFDQLLNEQESVTITQGAVVTGQVIDVKEDEIILNINYKADGVITRNEYTDEPNADLRTLVKVGDEIPAKVIKVNDGEGQVQLSYRKYLAEKGSQMLQEAFENGTVITASNAHVVKGGLVVTVDGSRIFIPHSLVSDVHERDLTKYEGQSIDFVITEFNPRKSRIIGDAKQVAVKKKAAMKEELFKNLEVGQVREGVVKNVTDFGAFIDLGGADGLLHISEMSWGRIENPKKVFKSGDHVKVLVKGIDGERIALTRKFPEENPWAHADEKYYVGAIVTGRVARMTNFGAFIELEEGIDALLHVSQISHERVEQPSDVLHIGDEITAKVVDFKPEEKKISLSIKQMDDADYDN